MKPVEDLSYPSQMDTHRFRERLKMLKTIEADFIAKRTGRSTEAHEAIYKKADQLINSPKNRCVSPQRRTPGYPRSIRYE